MTSEVIRPNIGIPIERQGLIRSWGEMSYLLEQIYGSDTFERRDLKFARAYFNSQKLVTENPKKAQRRFDRLEKIVGYNEFEAENKFLLRVIDIAVKGKSNQGE